MRDVDQRVLEILSRAAPNPVTTPGVRAPERAFAIREVNGQLTAFDGLIGASLVSAPGDGRMTKRRMFPKALSPAAAEVQVLVIELGGIYTYCRTVNGLASVIVSRDRLTP